MESQKDYVKRKLAKAGITIAPDQEDQVIDKILVTLKAIGGGIDALVNGVISQWKNEKGSTLQKLPTGFGIPQPVEQTYSDGSSVVPDNLLDLISPQEALQMAYYPVIAVKAAFKFALDLCAKCASRRLPYNKQTREIKQTWIAWQNDWMSALDPSTMKKLDDQLEEFFALAGWDVQCLWFVINQELKLLYPQLDKEYDILTPLYVCTSLLDFARFKESQYADRLEELTGKRPHCPEAKEIKAVRTALAVIGGKYTLDPTPMIQRAIKVIDNRLAQTTFQNVTRNEDEQGSD